MSDARYVIGISDEERLYQEPFQKKSGFLIKPVDKLDASEYKYI